MITQSRQGVKYTNDLISANNPVGLIQCLANENITTPRGSTEILLSNLMDSIFNNEPAKWARIVKCTPFNASANNWTTSAETIADIRESLEPGADVNTRFDLGEIFTQIGDFFGGSSTTGGGSTTQGNLVVGIVATIVVGAIAAIALFLIFKK